MCLACHALIGLVIFKSFFITELINNFNLMFVFQWRDHHQNQVKSFIIVLYLISYHLTKTVHLLVVVAVAVVCLFVYWSALMLAPKRIPLAGLITPLACPSVGPDPHSLFLHPEGQRPYPSRIPVVSETLSFLGEGSRLLLLLLIIASIYQFSFQSFNHLFRL